jgi:alpha/beta superfamily hydrolase
MKKPLLTFIFALLALLSYASDQFDLVYLPDSSSAQKPCLLIAPGNGYHKDLPIITDLAKQANDAGFVTLRFNWTPRDPKATDTEYNQSRYSDVLSMIDILRATAKVDTANIFIAGKSLGSIFAYNAALERRIMRGIVLLTPIFLDDELTAQIYPDLDSLYCSVTRRIPCCGKGEYRYKRGDSGRRSWSQRG